MLKAVNIGGVGIEVPIGLAPLAGVSDVTFRNICLEHGAGFVCTEMISAKAVVYENKNTYALLQSGENEHPSAVQLFGSDPKSLAAACEQINALPFDLIDFNMGCPAPKIVKNGDGSALLRDLKKAEAALLALVSHAKKPVTVKIRSGFDKEHINAVETAKLAESVGVSAITVHARTREQYYSGLADWNVIRAVKRAVSVPVFGNGDVVDESSAEAMLASTGCDGISIGRAAMGNPWIFKRIRHFLATGEVLPRPSKDEIIAMLLRHAELLCEKNGELAAVRQMRTHAPCYLKGFPSAAKLRGRINTVEKLSELRDLFS